MTLLPALLVSLTLTSQLPLAAREASRPSAAPDVAVVCPALLEPALAPWIEFRQEQGHKIAIVRAEQSPEVIRQQLRKLAEKDALRFVLLVGDADPALYSVPEVRARCVPANYVDAKINVRWGSEKHLSSDNFYADLDGDDMPDLAIGRLTADTSDELALIVRKIIAYEKTAGYGLWRRKVNFVAGVGGFGNLADAVLESSTRTLIAGGLPAAYESSMTYASWQSPYCPHPRSFRDATMARLNEGCLFWVYIGHGHYRTLDHLRCPEGEHRILTAEDIAQLRCESGNPIAFFLACYTGAYDAAQDCLAEEMLRTPGGPVAIFSGSRVTMPYAMAVMGTELLEECFVRNAPTLGEAIMNAKRAMLTESSDAKSTSTATKKNEGLLPGENEKAILSRRSLDMLASVISPAPEELQAERREHVQMFNLFGDPLLSLHHGATVDFQVPVDATAGEAFEVSGTSPLAGKCVIELVATRGLLTSRPAARNEYTTSAQAIAQQNAEYDAANNRQWTSSTVQVEPGPFRALVKVPPHATGQGHVCVFIEGEQTFAIGSKDIRIGKSEVRQAKGN